MNLADIKTDCLFFRGDVPCKPYKVHGLHCIDNQGDRCSHFSPADENAVHKYFTGIFDDISKANSKSHLQEIFEICDLKYSGE